MKLDVGLWGARPPRRGTLGFGRAARGAVLAAIIGMPSICCAGGSAALGAGQRDPAADHAALLPAKGKPLDSSVLDLEGNALPLAQLRGHPVLLDFFATWCEPCRVGLPHTDALVAKESKRGLVGWAISIDDHPDGVPAFSAKLGLQLPIRWDKGAQTADTLGVEILPAAIVLDSKGLIRYRGSADDRDFARHLEEATEALLAEEKK
jgi:thiol-disulfide isomerase/thioredoxin